jgi:hypothetical protein
MRREEFELLCHAVKNGDEKFVENMMSRYRGKVLACRRDGLTVEAFGHRFDWRPEVCRETRKTADPLGPPTNE